MSEETKWHKPRREALGVYVSEGNICIRQENAIFSGYSGESEDAIITLEPDQASEVIEWLQEALIEVRAETEEQEK
ncbi:MAG: hypothetical protein MI919_28715 [Holophagales bacterium]|nr:hypothetical protein [Holophagales bacterium]